MCLKFEICVIFLTKSSLSSYRPLTYNTCSRECVSSGVIIYVGIDLATSDVLL